MSAQRPRHPVEAAQDNPRHFAFEGTLHAAIGTVRNFEVAQKHMVPSHKMIVVDCDMETFTPLGREKGDEMEPKSFRRTSLLET